SIETNLPDQALGFRVQLYGITKPRELFTSRQLKSMTIFSDLVVEARNAGLRDAKAAGFQDDGMSLHEGGQGASAYADAVSVYLACAVSRLASYNNTICHWNLKGGSVSQIFTRHAIPMSWDFIEVCPLADFSGNWMGAISWISDVLDALVVGPPGKVKQ